MTRKYICKCGITVYFSKSMRQFICSCERVYDRVGDSLSLSYDPYPKGHMVNENYDLGQRFLQMKKDAMKLNPPEPLNCRSGLVNPWPTQPKRTIEDIEDDLAAVADNWSEKVANYLLDELLEMSK
jgi:hypothetical protein